MSHHPGEGRLPCCWPAGCGNKEIEGLEYCLHHVPDDLLDEAEDITGIRRCRHEFGDPGACRYYAKAGTVPPMCKVHGANRGSYQAKTAAGRVAEGKVMDRLAVIMSENGEKLARPDPIGNPFAELLDLAAEMKAFKEVMRLVTAYLFDQQRLRSAHSKVGEQLRAEVLLYERAQERLAAILVQITKLGIEDRLAAVSEHQAQMVEQALLAALRASGLDVAGQATARDALKRELRVIDGAAG